MNFKNTLLIVVLLAMYPALYAQHTISGMITDAKTKEPLIGALVYVSDLKIGTASDVDGAFQISNLKKGEYLLEISLLGYKTTTQRVVLYENLKVEIALTEAVTELNEIVITGVTRSTEIKQSPVIIKSLSRNHFLQSSSTNLIDGLKSVPGISQMTTGSSVSKPVIRGLGFNRIITLNNGVRQEGQQWGDEHGIEIDEFGVGRVEIIKGPGSLMYGSDGIAGVINFLAPQLPLDGKTDLQWISNYQSNNNLLANSLSYAGNKDGFKWSGRLSNKWSGAYENPYDGKVFNSGSKELNGNLFMGLSKRWGYSHLTLSSYNNHLGMMEGERDEDGRFVYTDNSGNEIMAPEHQGYALMVPMQKINHQSIVWNNYYLWGKGALVADFGFQNNRRREFEDPTDPDEPELFLNLNTFTYNVKYNFDKIKGWESALGFGGMFQQNINKGDEFLIPDYNLMDAGLFVFTQKNFKDLTFAAGLRLDERILKAKELHLDGFGHPIPQPDENSQLKFKPISKNLGGVSGSIGLSYPIHTTSTLKLNLSRGYRAPNIAELASNGKHEGTFRYELGNEDLKPEISHQIDLGMYFASEHITFELTPFINFIDNYIYLQQKRDLQNNTILINSEHNLPVYEFTSGNSSLYGAEVYFDIHPHPWDFLHFENTFSVVRGVQRNTGDNLPFMPAPNYRGEIKLDLNPAWEFLTESYIRLSLDHYFKQDKIFSLYETETPAYTLLGLGLGTRIKQNVNIYVNIDNLTNKAYQNHLSRLKYAPVNPLTGRVGIFNMGRNISLKFIVKI